MKPKEQKTVHSASSSRTPAKAPTMKTHTLIPSKRVNPTGPDRPPAGPWSVGDDVEPRAAGRVQRKPDHAAREAAGCRVHDGRHRQVVSVCLLSPAPPRARLPPRLHGLPGLVTRIINNYPCPKQDEQRKNIMSPRTPRTCCACNANAPPAICVLAQRVVCCRSRT